MSRILAGDAPVELLVDGGYVLLNPGDPIPLPDYVPVGCLTVDADAVLDPPAENLDPPAEASPTPKPRRGSTSTAPAAEDTPNADSVGE
jgi:hypothetical protein